MEKKNKWGILIIIVIAFLLLGSGIFLTLNPDLLGNNEEVKEEEKKDTETTELSLDDASFINVVTTLDPYTTSTVRPNGYQSFNDYEKGALGALGIELADFVATNVTDANGRNIYQIKGEAFLRGLQKVFPFSIDFDRNALINQTVTLSFMPAEGNLMTIQAYDNTTDTFNVVLSNSGALSSQTVQIIDQKITKATLKDNTITVTKKKIYYNADPVTFTYQIFADPEKTVLLDTKTFDSTTAWQQVISIDDYIEQATTVTYTLEQDEISKNYVFVKNEIEPGTAS